MVSRRDKRSALVLDPDTREPLVVIGVIMGSHGLHGDLRVKQINLASDLLPTAPSLIVRNKAGKHVRHVVDVRPADKGLYMHLEGIESVEVAKTFHGSELCVPRSALPPLQDGEFYFTDLEGLDVVKPDGSSVGTAIDVFEYPASAVLRVQLAEGILEVPLREPYLVAVDVPARRITVDHVEDLEIEVPRRKA